jgi:hypothetical protein
MDRDALTYEIITEELTRITLDEVIALASQALTIELSDYSDDELKELHTFQQGATPNTNDNKRMH